MTDYQKALTDPTSVYQYPKDLLVDDSLTQQQKLVILERWKQDAIELMVADEENMAGDSPTMLSRVNRAIGIVKGELDMDAPYE